MWVYAHEKGVRMGGKLAGTGTGRRQRRSCTASCRAEGVPLVRQGDRTIPTICREPDLSETAVRRCVEQAAVEGGHGRADERGPRSRQRATICRALETP